MNKHFFFFFTYIALNGIFPAEILHTILIFHCVIGIYDNVKTKNASLITIYYVSVILVSYANILLIGKVGTVTNSVYYYIIPEYIKDATLIWCVGNTSIFMGYQYFIKKTLPSITTKLKRGNFKTIFFAVIILTTLTTFGKSINLSFLGSGALKVLFLLNIVSILFFSRLWKKENNKIFRNYALILCVIQTFSSLQNSYLRSEIIIPFLSFTGGYFLGLGNVKYLFTYKIAPFAFVFIMYVIAFKQLGNNRAHFIDVLYDNNTKNNEVTAEENTADEKERGGFLDRSANLAQITNCVKLVKVKGFYNGNASAPLITGLVPRFLWPEKPSIRLGAWFAVEIGVAYVNAEGQPNNSINMTIPGELYLDFGIIGVIIGCFFLGGLLSMFWNAAHFNESIYDLTGTMWGGYLSLYALQSIGADLQIIISFFSTYFVFYLIKKASRT